MNKYSMIIDIKYEKNINTSINSTTKNNLFMKYSFIVMKMMVKMIILNACLNIVCFYLINVVKTKLLCIASKTGEIINEESTDRS